MDDLSRRMFIGSILSVPLLRAEDEWVPLFDGKSLSGWKASENQGGWSMKDGCLEFSGQRSHLFYTGSLRNAGFKNFELKADVMTWRGANSGIFFHTKYQQSGWPEQGFEVQVCNSCEGEGSYRERKKTGSLYGVRNVYKAFAKDEEWFQLRIAVRGKNVQVRLNEMLIVDYVEPDQPTSISKAHSHILGRGTFALQGHDAGSRVRYRNILVRPLPDDAVSPNPDKPVVDSVYTKLLELSDKNYPLVDYHVHLKSINIEEALRESRRLGIHYGIAVNCGVGFPINDDSGVMEFFKSMAGQPVFVAMQAEGREWVKTFSKEVITKFDYVFTDAMTFTDDNGKRMRLWMKNEVGEVGDKQKFMDVIVDRIHGVLSREPIDIYVNPTFLPEVIAADYDELWTPERMGKVIEAARRNDIAIEINARYKIPSARFIKAAKQAGVKFSFGTNNADGNLGRLEYCLKMVDECGLTWQDIFVPRIEGEKAIQRRSL
jgi:hypothetical protein